MDNDEKKNNVGAGVTEVQAGVENAVTNGDTTNGELPAQGAAVVANNEPSDEAVNDESRRRSDSEREVKKSRRKIIILVVIALLLAGGAVVLVLFLTGVIGGSAEPEPETEPVTEEVVVEEEVPQYYSALTGLPISDEAQNKQPTFCVQVPNGTDGARPQAGLNQAGVIFEAIAEKGITRFAAVFQGVDEIAAIGPIRSLRLYYLQWDVPFDCTVVHDGGADDALAAVRSYKDFTGFSGYVWRSATSSLNRKWNNEFTSGELLLAYNEKRGYGESDVDGFTRMTPEESLISRVDASVIQRLDIDTEAEGSTQEQTAAITQINFTYGNMPNYNPVYNYDAETNTYKRSYESGTAHMVYDCEGQSGKITPENVCQSVQLAPSVVIAMMVEEKRASDNYHEDITAVGSGKAYIFQNGGMIEGAWRKASVGEQIRFYDNAGVEVRLAPGQTFVSAIPNYGKVAYQ